MRGASDFERNLIHKVELFWFMNQRYPTSASLARELGVDISDVEDAIRHNRDVKRQLKLRGVDRVLLTGDSVPVELDEFRMNVALGISNIHGGVKIHERLAEMNVSEAQFRGWQQDPLFMNFLRMRSIALAAEEMPEINRTLLRKAGNGDNRAMKLVMEVTGQLISDTTVPGNAWQSGQDPMFIVKKLVEVIRRHVKDPEVISLIARDFDEALNSTEPIEAVIKQRELPPSTPSLGGGYRF